MPQTISPESIVAQGGRQLDLATAPNGYADLRNQVGDQPIVTMIRDAKQDCNVMYIVSGDLDIITRKGSPSFIGIFVIPHHMIEHCE